MVGKKYGPSQEPSDTQIELTTLLKTRLKIVEIRFYKTNVN